MKQLGLSGLDALVCGQPAKCLKKFYESMPVSLSFPLSVFQNNQANGLYKEFQVFVSFDLCVGGQIHLRVQ